MDNNNLLAIIKRHVKELFHNYAQPYLIYHNFEHTQEVVTHAQEIADYYLLEADEQFVLLAAAWFHDVGHLMGEPSTHEEKGVEMMQYFSRNYQLSKKIQQEIARCIFATKMPVRPVTLLEKIICDADTYHLGTADFFNTNTLVWQEMELRTGQIVDNQTERTIHFLESHIFHANYCRELLTFGKIENITHLKRKSNESG